MFGIFKNKDAEEVASEINKIHSQIYKLAKKNTDGTYSISKKVIEKDFKSNKIETTNFGVMSSAREKKWTSVAFFQVPDNDNGKAVKEILVNDYKFKGIEQ